MRIITGTAKGCKLKAPKGMDTRPTSDRTKESLFSILGNRIWDAEILDLFAGTGNLGLEALSRGARRAVFVDQSAEAVRTIRENAEHTKLVEKVEIYKADIEIALERLKRSDRKFQIIFCDPPYRKNFADRVIRAIGESTLLKKDGILVIEHAAGETTIEQCGALRMTDSRRYGAAGLRFFGFALPDESNILRNSNDANDGNGGI